MARNQLDDGQLTKPAQIKRARDEGYWSGFWAALPLGVLAALVLVLLVAILAKG